MDWAVSKFMAVKGSSVSTQLAWLPGSGVQRLSQEAVQGGAAGLLKGLAAKRRRLALGSPYIIQ